VVHLHLEGDKLYAATDLGGHFTWDLSAFSIERCKLLQQVWASVPVVWEHGRAVKREPPAEHPCR
jgi:hypothetical protein